MVRAKFLAISLLGLACGFIFLGTDIRIGIRVRAFDLLLLGVIAVFAWHALTKGVRRELGGFLIAYGAFALYIFCNGLLQVSMGTAVKELVQMVLFLGFFLALTQYLDDARATRLFVQCFLGVLWVLALYNGFHHASQGIYSGWKDLGDQKLTHSILLVVLVVLMAAPDRKRGLWPVVILLAALVFLFLSGERKGWVAAAVAILPVLLIAEQGGIALKTLRRTGLVAVFGASLIAMVALIAPYVPYLEKQLVSAVEFAQLLFSDADQRNTAETTLSNQGRLVTIELALHHIRENPWFGLGPERFKPVSASLAFLPIGSDDLKGVHNELLRIGAELGFVGLFLYGVLNLVIALRAIAAISKMGGMDASARLRVRLGVALFCYGFAVNVFLAGGGLNTFFVLLPAGLLYSVSLAQARVQIAQHHRAARKFTLGLRRYAPKTVIG